MAISRGIAEVVHDDHGWAKELIAAGVAALSLCEDNLIGLVWIMANGNGFVPVGVERLTDTLDGLNAVALEQPPQLLQRQCHPLMQRIGGIGMPTSQGAFEIVHRRQQFADKRFLLRRSLLLGIAPGALYEVIEISGEAQMIGLPGGEFLL